jgi:hypothetical protein
MGGSAGTCIVVDANGLEALGQLLLFDCGIALGLDLCLAFAVGGLGLLEDVDNVLALRAVSTARRAYRVLAYRRLTLLTTLPLLLMTVMVSPTPILAN